MRNRRPVSEWAKVQLGDVAKVINGRPFKPHQWSDRGLPIIRIQNLNGSNDFNYYNGSFDPKLLVTPGTLLFAWSGSKGSSFGPHFWRRPENGLLNYHTWKLEPSSKVDQRYLYQSLKKLTKEIEGKAHGAAGLVHIQKGWMESWMLNLPTLAEQREIAAILGTWDEALDKLDTLIAAKDRRKQALLQQLLTVAAQKVGHGHARHRLGVLVERVTRKNAVGNDNVLTISAQQGLINQREYFNRNVAGADLSGYYLLRRGEFAYNRSSSIGFPYGAIKRLDHYDSGIVSTLYLCFRIKDDAEVSSDYLTHYLDGGFLNPGLRSIAKEGARAHGLLNVTADEFFDLDVFIPPLVLQKKIAAILGSAESELRLLRQQRAALDQQKRGLMQILLTGQKRVRV